MALNPRIFIGPDRMTMSRPGFDASDPDLAATEVLFDTRYANMAMPFQTTEFAPVFGTETIPIVGAPLANIPLLTVAYRAPGNLFQGGTGNGSGDVYYPATPWADLLFQQTTFNPITGRRSTFTSVDLIQKAVDLENVYLRRQHLPAGPAGWVTLYHLGDLHQTSEVKEIAADSDDDYWIEGTGWGSVEVGAIPIKQGVDGGDTFEVAWRFTGLNMPADAELEKALISLDWYGASGGGSYGRLYGHAVADAPTWGGATTPANMPKTTAFAEMTDELLDFPNQFLDVTAIVDEIKALPGWNGVIAFGGDAAPADGAIELVPIEETGTGSDTQARLTLHYKTPPAGRSSLLIGKRGADMGMWASKPGFDAETAGVDGMVFSTQRPVAMAFARGSVVMDGNKDVDLGLDLGYAPLIRWYTDSGSEVSCLRYIDNRNVRFYRRFTGNVASYNLHWWAFNQELPNAPEV